MPQLIFTFPDQAALAANMHLSIGQWEWRQFPDGESYVRVLSEVRSEEAIILCSLNNPDPKTMPLLFLARTLKEMGAGKITLVAPYLGYMRQDKRFHDGEAVTSDIFASILSPFIDALITIDPHLHRHHALEEIYRCECKALSAASLMAEWIKTNRSKALIIGPDMESEQWVSQVAQTVDSPYVILEKIRHGDRNVEITIPDVAKYQGYQPVLVDDIISTAGTMIKAAGLLRQQGLADITCLATHGLFAADAYSQLQKAGVKAIVTANTIPHESNGLDVAAMVVGALC